MADQISLALSRFQEGDSTGALSILDTILKKKPRDSFAWFLSGVIYIQNCNSDLATHAFKKAIKNKPNYPEAHNNLGVVMESVGDLRQASICYQKAIKQRHNYANAYYNLANLQKNETNFDDAINNYLLAIKYNPEYHNAINNLALIHQHFGEFDKSRQLFNQAINLSPDDIEFKNNLGFNYYCQFQYNEALALFQSILQTMPNYAPTKLNMGLLMQAMNDYDKAKMYFIEASHDEDHKNRAMNNLAHLELSNGFFERGWQYYQDRPSIRDLSFKLIDDLLSIKDNKSILIYKDQGIGDEIFFSRYIPLLKQYNANISYYTDKKLESFWNRKFENISILTSEPKLREFDNIISLGDLPRLFYQAGYKEIPCSLLLSPKSNALEQVKKQLPNNGKPNIAITWEAGVRGQNKLFKKVPVSVLGKLLSTIDANILVIQRNPKSEDIAIFKKHLKRKFFNYEYINDNLEEMMAFLYHVDEYVGVSNTNIHIRALLGKASHVLVPYPAEWRWMEKDNQSLWFPTSRVYRQSVNGGWDFVLQISNN